MKNFVFFNVFQWSTFFVLGPPGGYFGEVLGLILEPLGTMLGHLGGQHGSKSRPSDQNVMSNFDLKFDVRFFGLTGSVADLRWRSWTAQYSCSAGKLEELGVISYAMHHGNDAADPLPTANPATALGIVEVICPWMVGSLVNVVRFRLCLCMECQSCERNGLGLVLVSHVPV